MVNCRKLCAGNDIQSGAQSVEPIATTASTTGTDEFRWNHGNTILLINTYADHQHMFESSAVKRNEVWRKIAAHMSSQGCHLSWEACEKKMRNLKYR